MKEARPHSWPENVAEQQTVSHVSISTERFPWVNEAHEVPTTRIDSESGQYWLGDMTACSGALSKLAAKDMQGRDRDARLLDELMHRSIQTILQGRLGVVRRVRNAPAGTAIFYGALDNGARIFFVDTSDAEGRRTFLKTAVCGSKGNEGAIFKVFSGNKKEKVK